MSLITAIVLILWIACAPGLVNAQAGDPGVNPAADLVAETLRERLEQFQTSGRIDVGNTTIVAKSALLTLYESNGYRPFWNAERLELLRRLVLEAKLDGLNPEDYHVSALTRLAPNVASPELLMRAQIDLLATDAYYLLVYHLYFGKVAPVAVHPAWNVGARPDAEDDAVPAVYTALSGNQLAEGVAKARPTHWLYERMRAALADYRSLETQGGWQTVPPGETLKPGMKGTRVVALRHRLAATGELAGQPLDDATFDAPLAVATKEFQQRHRIAADGVVGPSALAELNVPVAKRIGQIRVNLERARWALHGITADDVVVVDVAGFEVTLLRNHEVRWQGKVQVGKPYRQTPIFKSAIDYVVLNPTWTVPPGILQNDILPAMRTDPMGTLARKKLQVLDRNGQVLDPSVIAWGRYTGKHFPYLLRQQPGPDNALGQVKINFPNAHLVYLHDTPSKSLFDKDERAFSSGCIRVQKPLGLVELLLNDPKKWSRASIDAVLKTPTTRTVRLKNPVPVLLMYWTIDPTANGHPTFKRDPYSRDAPLLQALDAPYNPDSAVHRKPGS